MAGGFRSLSKIVKSFDKTKQANIEKDHLFSNFKYQFSQEEIDNTDWYQLVHHKKLRRKMVAPINLK